MGREKKNNYGQFLVLLVEALGLGTLPSSSQEGCQIKTKAEALGFLAFGVSTEAFGASKLGHHKLCRGSEGDVARRL